MDRELHYVRYYKNLITFGVGEAMASFAVEHDRRCDRELDANRCPACRRPLRGTHGKRASGMAELRGYWLEYHCPCGYMRTRLEDPPPNTPVA